MYAYVILFIMIINGFFTQPLFGMLTLINSFKHIGDKNALLFRPYPNLHHLPPVIQKACTIKLQAVEEKKNGLYSPTPSACDKLHMRLEDALSTQKKLFVNRYDYCHHILKNPRSLRFSTWCENMKPPHSLAVGIVVSAVAWSLHIDSLFMLNTFLITPFVVLEHDSRMTTEKAIKHLLSDKSSAVVKQENENFSKFLYELRNKKKSGIEKE